MRLMSICETVQTFEFGRTGMHRFRNEERQLQCLLLVQTRIAVGKVCLAQILVLQAFTSSSALCHSICCQLQMDAAQIRPALLMNAESR